MPERFQIKIYDLETSPRSLHTKTPIVLVNAAIFEERKQPRLGARLNISMQSRGFLVKCQCLWPWHVHGRAARERCHLLWIIHSDPWALRRPPKPRVALSLNGDSLLGSREGLTAAASAPQLLWDGSRHKSCTRGDFLAEFAKWSRISIWGEAVIKGVLVFSVKESRGKSITLGWKVNLNAKIPFMF